MSAFDLSKLSKTQREVIDCLRIGYKVFKHGGLHPFIYTDVDSWSVRSTTIYALVRLGLIDEIEDEKHSRCSKFLLSEMGRKVGKMLQPNSIYPV